MTWYSIFYWLTVADNAKTMFTVFTVIFSIIAIVSTIWFIVDRDGSDLTTDKNSAAERAKKWVWWSYPFAILFWALFVFTPNKKDALLIVAGGGAMEFLTSDSSAKQLPHELTSFVVTELHSMAKDAQIDIITNDYKKQVLDQAKSMSGAQLIEAMKDSSFANIILNK